MKKRALYINLIGLWTILSITMCIGLVIFAKYKDCDPIRSNQVKSAEQVLHRFKYLKNKKKQFYDFYYILTKAISAFCY